MLAVSPQFPFKLELKADQLHLQDMKIIRPCLLITDKTVKLFKQESSDRQAHKRTDGLYQFYYLPALRSIMSDS